jgi:hypothetical protein
MFISGKASFAVPAITMEEHTTIDSVGLVAYVKGQYEDMMKLDFQMRGRHLIKGSTLKLDNVTIKVDL